MILSNGAASSQPVEAVGGLGLDVLVLGVALVDQLVVQAPRALGERRDDLDRVGILGEVGDVGRLHARTGADLEHLLAALDVDDVGHAALDVRAGHGHAIADVEEGMLVAALGNRRADRGELFARGEQEGAHRRLAPDVLVADQGLEAIPALAEGNGILTAGLAPGDEVLARVHRRVEIPAVGLDRGSDGRGGQGTGGERDRAGDESAPLQDIPPWRGPVEREGQTAGKARRFGGDRAPNRYGNCGGFASAAMLGGP